MINATGQTNNPVQRHQVKNTLNALLLRADGIKHHERDYFLTTETSTLCPFAALKTNPQARSLCSGFFEHPNSSQYFKMKKRHKTIHLLPTRSILILFPPATTSCTVLDTVENQYSEGRAQTQHLLKSPPTLPTKASLPTSTRHTKMREKHMHIINASLS